MNELAMRTSHTQLFVPCRWRWIAIAAFVLMITACAGQAPTAPADRLKPTRETASAGALAPLYPLNESSSADFRSAFDEGKDHTRFIVALSPT
jgi:hypothetical protein